MSKAAELAALIGSQTALSNRNLIINGAMQVAQRGTSSTSTGFQTVDRFQTSASTDATITQSQTALTSGSPYDEGFRDVYRQTVTTASSSPAAGHYFGVLQYIEASTIDTSGWKHTSDSSYLTLSFWVKSSVAGTYVFQFRTNDGTAQAYTFEYTLVADTWKKVTHSIPGNSSITVNNDNGRGLELYWWIYLGTNFDDSSHTNEVWEAYSGSSQSKVFAQNWMTTASATFDVTGVQLEVGEQATPFEHRSFADELRRCQRYHYRRDITIYDVVAMGGVTSTNRGAYLLHLPTAMRAKPSCSQGSHIYCWYTAAGSVTSQSNLVVVYMNNDTTEFNQVYLRADANSSLASVTHPLALTSYHSSGTADTHISLDAEL